MNKGKDHIWQLKQLIKIELEDCNSDLWPNVCKLRHAPGGYKKIEEMIIRLVSKEAMLVGAAIAHIEQELSHIY
ncbi:hypothetical protein JYU20_03165 [Bacteroidales bacterium AH-315-I05]|nr:hypothetical protein [Bacteroidales bacterium AH-315-I05]